MEIAKKVSNHKLRFREKNFRKFCLLLKCKYFCNPVAIGATVKENRIDYKTQVSRRIQCLELKRFPFSLKSESCG